MTDSELTRRRLLELGSRCPARRRLGRPARGGSGACARADAAIADDDEPTPELTEGPYFTPNSPRRRSIVPAGARGTRLDADGPRAHDRRTAGPAGARRLLAVRRTRCLRQRGLPLPRPPAHRRARPLLAASRSSPGSTPGRTKHIHVKVQAPGEPVLTTQLFFPGVAGNRERRDLRRRVPRARLALVKGRRRRALRLRARPLAPRKNSQSPPSGFTSAGVFMGCDSDERSS